MFQPLLCSYTEVDGPWEEESLERELENLEEYKKQAFELFRWVKPHYATMKRVAGIYGIDINVLTEDDIESVPEMPKVLRDGFYCCLTWYTIARRCEKLIEYQAEQKRMKRSFGRWPRLLHAVKVF